MGQNKLPSKKSTEELLQDLNLPDDINEQLAIKEEIINHEDDSVLTFLRFYNIEPGKNSVKARYLYKLYTQFAKNPISNKRFNVKLGLYLKYEEENSINKAYLINEKVLNISKKALELLEKQTKHQEKSTTWIIHFQHFLNKYDIKEGKRENWVWVSFPILYNLYDKWHYENKEKKTRISLKALGRLLKIHFEFKQVKYVNYFKLDNSVLLKSLPLGMKSKIKSRNRLLNETKKQEKP